MGLSSTIVFTFLCLCTLHPPSFLLLHHVPLSLLPSTFFPAVPFSFFNLVLLYFSNQSFSPILITYPSHFNCPRCIVTSIDSTFSSSLYILSISYFIQFSFIFCSSYRNLISVLFVLLLCLSFVVHDSHECANIGFTTLLTTSTFILCGISILLRNYVFIELYSFMVLASISLVPFSKVMIPPRYLNMPVCSMLVIQFLYCVSNFRCLLSLFVFFQCYISGLFLLDVRLLYLHFLVGFPQYFLISSYRPRSIALWSVSSPSSRFLRCTISVVFTIFNHII